MYTIKVEFYDSTDEWGGSHVTEYEKAELKLTGNHMIIEQKLPDGNKGYVFNLNTVKQYIYVNKQGGED